MKVSPLLPGRPQLWLFCTAFFLLFVSQAAWSADIPASAERPNAAMDTGDRAPAYPLITHDPYFSIWSFNDRLTDGWSRHWTGVNHALASMIRVDGDVYRLMGREPDQVGALPQTGLQVTPTRTIYRFADQRIALTLTFLSPLIAGDLELLSRPASYITWEIKATDRKSHNVAVYFDHSAEHVVSALEQQVTWFYPAIPRARTMAIGSQQQPVLQKSGDRIGIDWGYLYQATEDIPGVSQVAAGAARTRASFAAGGTLPPRDDGRMPRAANDDWPVLATSFDFGAVGAAPVIRYLVLAYDDLYSVEYMKKWLRPYWRRHGAEGADMVAAALDDYPRVAAAAAQFDDDLMADMTRVGGPRYAHMGAIAYRQSIAAHKAVAGPDGSLFFFSKENSSNGCMATVDVAMPAAPLYLLMNLDLLKAMLEPVFLYAENGKWPFPFAPHDLGTYPKANGQVYGGGETSQTDQMPVEESGNMLILTAMIVKLENRPDYARKHWQVLTRWAAYLKEQGFDPAGQLSTDDFTGHLAHNVNLSAKAIVALGAYAQMAGKLDEPADAAQYDAIARDFARKWMEKADDGDHYRLAFDRPGTWSQKYNLIWHRILGLNDFPQEVFDREYAYYTTKVARFGVPLDNRATYTIMMWNVWTAMFTGLHEDFDRLASPLYDFIAFTPDRIPLTDWIETQKATAAGFQARSTVGGLFMPMLGDLQIWNKWLLRGGY